MKSMKETMLKDDESLVDEFRPVHRYKTPSDEQWPHHQSNHWS